MLAGADPGLSRARDGSGKDRWASPCPRQEEARTTGRGVQSMADIYREAAESIVSSDRAAAEAVAQRALDQGIAPGDIMAKGFVKGIQEVGELFESGELFLPELMMSADAMAGATAVTNAALEGAAAEAKGRIVIGTVQGDVHDIGKAIVIAYLKANGYEVSDLGRDVPAASFIARAKEENADIIGMSALLTTTMEEQRKVIKTVKTRACPTRPWSAAPPARSAGPTRSAPTPTPRTPTTGSRRSTRCWASKQPGPRARPRPEGRWTGRRISAALPPVTLGARPLRVRGPVAWRRRSTAAATSASLTPRPSVMLGGRARKERSSDSLIRPQPSHLRGGRRDPRVRRGPALGGRPRPLRDPGPPVSLAVRPALQLRADVRAPRWLDLVRAFRGGDPFRRPRLRPRRPRPAGRRHHLLRRRPQGHGAVCDLGPARRGGARRRARPAAGRREAAAAPRGPPRLPPQPHHQHPAVPAVPRQSARRAPHAGHTVREAVHRRLRRGVPVERFGVELPEQRGAGDGVAAEAEEVLEAQPLLLVGRQQGGRAGARHLVAQGPDRIQ